MADAAKKTVTEPAKTSDKAATRTVSEPARSSDEPTTTLAQEAGTVGGDAAKLAEDTRKSTAELREKVVGLRDVAPAPGDGGSAGRVQNLRVALDDLDRAAAMVASAAGALAQNTAPRT